MTNPLTSFLDLVDQAGNAYISSAVASIAGAAEPVFRLLLILFFIIYGIGIWRGAIRTEASQFFWAMIKVGIIYTFVFSWSIYNAVIVDFFTNGPDALAAVVTNSPKNTMTSTLGDSYEQVIASMELAFESDGWFLPYILGLIIFLSGTIVIIYTAFLIGLAKFALTLLVAIGPIAFIMLFYNSTRRMFEAWLQQCINFFLYIVFTAGVLALSNAIFKKTIVMIPDEAIDITLGSIVPLVICCFVIWLVLKQVPALASSIAGGAQISSLGMEDVAVRAGRRMGSSVARGAGRLGLNGMTGGWNKLKKFGSGSRHSVSK